jgi:hypothetical protein
MKAGSKESLAQFIGSNSSFSEGTSRSCGIGITCALKGRPQETAAIRTAVEKQTRKACDTTMAILSDGDDTPT